MKIFKPILIFLFCLFVADIFCQSKYTLKIIDNQTDNEINFKYFKAFNHVFERDKEINRVKNYFSDNGFLAFSIDSTTEDSLNKTLYINKGLSYQWAKINTVHIDEDILKKTGYSSKKFEKKTVDIEKLKKFKQNIIMFCENNGYPFAEVQLDSISIKEDLIEASLILKKNNLIIYDSIILKGKAEIKVSFLYDFLGIKQGALYNESYILKTDKRVNDLPFLKVKEPSSIIFYDDKCHLLINADKKKASNFDGILGIIPDNITGNVVLTGDVKLKLINSFKSAETLEFNWKRINVNSQRLYAGFSSPYMFSSQLGSDYYIDILQKDTTYVSVKQTAGIKYMFDGFDYVNFTGDFYNSNLLSTANFEVLNSLPDYADISTVLFGMGFNKENFDFRLNPRKGYSLNMSILAGNKVISKNPKLNESLYDGISLKSKQYKYDVHSNVFFNPYKKNVLMLGVNAGKIFSPNLFQNELYRLGGAKTLRGFDEESVFASLYSVFTFEYRYLVENMSFINVFWDGAYYENRSINKKVIDRPFGFGAGFTFETKQGIFSISYALGKQFNNPVQFKAGKIHLGYINYF